MERKCSKCQITKPLDRFAWSDKSRNRRHYICKECRCIEQRIRDQNSPRDRKQSKKAWRKANPEKCKAQQARKKARLVLMIREAKDKPCMDCGISYPHWVMDFDHVRGTKRSVLSRAHLQSWGRQQILDEIAKCDVVCANCHRLRHPPKSQTPASPLVAPPLTDVA